MSEPFLNVNVFSVIGIHEIKLAENLDGNVTTIGKPTIAYFLGNINKVRLSGYLDQNLKLTGFRIDEKLPTTIYMKLVEVRSTGLKFGEVI